MVKLRRFPPVVPYLVAVLDEGHGGKANLARRLVVLAAEAGAHAVKLTIPGTMERLAPELLDMPWRGDGRLGRTQRDTLERLRLSVGELSAVRKEARGRLQFIAAPQDDRALEIALRLRPDAYQVDAPLLGDLALVRAIGRVGRPVLLVVGMCTERAIEAALRALGRAPVVLVHTVAAPGAAAPRLQLGHLPRLRRRYKRTVGYFGVEPGTAWSLVAACLGADVIEKSFTLDRSLDGQRRHGHLEPAEFRALAADLRDLPKAVAPTGPRRVLGDELDVLAGEGHCLVARRRLSKGACLRPEDLTVEAPMRGLSPRLMDWLVGRRLAYDVAAGEPITFGLVE